MRALPGVGLLEPPHVSLGYPWLPADEALARVEDVRAAAGRVPAFGAGLTGPHTFAPDGRGRVLVHARLADDAPVRVLAGLLGADLREVHLSLARVLPGGDLPAVLEALAPLLPRLVAVRVLELTVRRAGVWSTGTTAGLGG